MALPQLVLDLAGRLGATSGGAVTRTLFAQRGKIRSGAVASWMDFTAIQWLGVHQTGFRWRAKIGPFATIRVEDSLIGGIAKGEVALFGLLPISRAKPGSNLIKGQLMRYLAELPWMPDAILANRELAWRTLADDCLSVSTSCGDVTGDVTFTLDSDGFPVTVEGFRPRDEGGIFHERPWQGNFSDFREVEGRIVPHRGTVAWTLDGHRTKVWQGELTHWQMRSAKC